MRRPRRGAEPAPLVPRPPALPLPETLPDGAWLGVIDPAFLALRYPEWLPPEASHDAAVAAFRRHGFAAMAPLAEGHEFEPSYFREVNPAFDDRSDLDCFRDWLVSGIAGQPGSAAAHLRRLGLPPKAYPAGFPWLTYVRHRPRYAAHRWAALDALFATRDVDFPLTADSAPLLCAVARRVLGEQDREAIRLYERARAAAALPSPDRQHLADAYLRQELWRPALEGYRAIVADGTPDGWTFRNLALCARQLGLAHEIAEDLARADPAVRADPHWDGTVIQAGEAMATEAIGAARLLMAERRYAAAANRLAAGIATLAAVMERIDIRPPAARPNPDTVLLVANLDDGESTARRVHEKAALLDRLGIPHATYPYGESGRVLEALPASRAVIFFRVPALPQGLRCILAARRLGITTIYESDAQLHGAAPAFESFHGRVPDDDYDNLRLALMLQAIAQLMCDRSIAPCQALARTLPGAPGRMPPFVVRDSHLPALVAEAGGSRAPELRLFLRLRAITFIDVAPRSFGACLLAALEEVPGLHLDLSGPVTLDPAFDRLGARVRHGGYARTPEEYWPLLAGVDVALAVSDGSADAAYDAELRWAEAAALGRPCLLFGPDLPAPDGDDVGAGPEATADPGAWRAALDRLIGGLPARRVTPMRHSRDDAARELGTVLADV